MSIKVTVKARGAKKVSKALKGFSSDISEARGMNLALLTQILGWVKRNFKAEGSLNEGSEGPWKKLSPATIARRIKGSSAILQDTGALLNRWDIKATRRGGTLTSRQNYSDVHEEGLQGIPKRKIFPTDRQGGAIAARGAEALLTGQ